MVTQTTLPGTPARRGDPHIISITIIPRVFSWSFEVGGQAGSQVTSPEQRENTETRALAPGGDLALQEAASGS